MPSTTQVKFRVVTAVAVIALSPVLVACGEASPSNTTTDVEALVRYVGVLEEANAELQRQLDEATRPDGSSAESTLQQATINGSYEIWDIDFSGALGMVEHSGSCWGRDRYSDMGEGTNVVVRDGAGNIVGTGSFGRGEGNELACRFTFAVDVPASLDFYEIEVSNRGGTTYSYEDLEASGWMVQLTLG